MRRTGPAREATTARVGIIGGSGFADLEGLDRAAVESIETPYGGAEIVSGDLGGHRVAFLPRHGRDNTALPHVINHEANIWALREWGATRILSSTTVGSLNPRMKVGDLVVVDQFIDFLRRGPLTYGLGHVDMTYPYCEELRQACLRTAGRRRLRVHRRGLYLCCDGPRYETAGEIRAFRRWGADLVGMTHVPEAVLSREIGLCYAAVALVVNIAAGLSRRRPNYAEHRRQFAKHSAKLREFLLAVLDEIPERARCVCAGAVARRGRAPSHAGSATDRSV